MKKCYCISIMDGILRSLIVLLTCNTMCYTWNMKVIIIGIMISCFSLIYTYKSNKGKIGYSYFFSIFTEIFLIGFEMCTGYIGMFIRLWFPVRVDDPAPGDGFLTIGYLFTIIVITIIVRIILGIKEFIRWYKS